MPRSNRMRLLEIPVEEAFVGPIPLPPKIREIVESTQAFYSRSRSVSPWLGYLVWDGVGYRGTCAFKSPPLDEKVEIAYWTFTEHEGKGVATFMVKALCEIARQRNSTLTLVAQTLPATGPSTSVLKKVGFTFHQVVDHPEDGEVWEWTLPLSIYTGSR